MQEKWEDITFDTVLLDHYWLPDSVVWLNKGYMVSEHLTGMLRIRGILGGQIFFVASRRTLALTHD